MYLVPSTRTRAAYTYVHLVRGTWYLVRGTLYCVPHCTRCSKTFRAQEGGTLSFSSLTVYVQCTSYSVPRTVYGSIRRGGGRGAHHTGGGH